jgi:transcriptional regulator with XRE-family HTH domain
LDTYCKQYYTQSSQFVNTIDQYFQICYALDMTKMISFPEWLEKYFVNWVAKQGKRTSLNEFAAYLGYSRPTITAWMNGSRTPSLEAVEKLASKVGPEVFDVMELPRHDPDLQTLIYLWPNLSEEARHTLREQGEKYVTENEQNPARSGSMEETT